jgi:hypothetical protein
MKCSELFQKKLAYFDPHFDARAPEMKDNFAQKFRTLYLALRNAIALRGSVGKAPMLDSRDFELTDMGGRGTQKYFEKFQKSSFWERPLFDEKTLFRTNFRKSIGISLLPSQDYSELHRLVGETPPHDFQ